MKKYYICNSVAIIFLTRNGILLDKSVTEKLKEHQIRPTQIRIEILNIFHQSDFALSHADIVEQIGEKFDRVTIYRALDILDKNGLIHKITDDFVTAKYALCIDGSCLPNQHKCEHVHFKCLNCGNIFCISPEKMPIINLPETYQIQSLSISAKGFCENCKERS
jgi:Fur family transcriptional regulator, ferric uptake regulator